MLNDLEARPIMPERLPSLEPMTLALNRMGTFQSPRWKPFSLDPKKIVIVAGTNGKGSVCASLERLCRSAGESVGLYTSPHLERLNERFRIDGLDVDDDSLVQSHRRVQKLVADLPLTHFEILTAMCVDLFILNPPGRPLDRIILEVGLGGQSDATNAIPHGICVFTTIGLDHTQILGPDVASIGRQKLGVLSGVPEGHEPFVVFSDLPTTVLPVVREFQSRFRGIWTEAPPFKAEISPDGSFLTTLESSWGKARLTLTGRRAAWNANLALTAFEVMGHDPSQHLSALSQIRWGGRFEPVESSQFLRPTWLSGDHNPEGIKSLIEILSNHRGPISILVGLGKEKDLEGVLDPIFSLDRAKIYLTETPFRGRPIEAYGSYLRRAQASSRDWKQLLKSIHELAAADELIVVTGSLYLVGEVRSWLMNGDQVARQ